MENLSFFQILAALWIWFLGHFFAYIFVANFIYLPMKTIDNKEEKEEILYENKYLLKNISNNYYNPNDISKEVYITDMTPEGYVFMRYNNEEQGFEYWSDNSNVKYIYLETISRKYITNFLCKNIYKNRKKEQEEQEEAEKLEEQGEQEESEKLEDLDEENAEKSKQEIIDLADKPDETDDIFVKPKISEEKNKIKRKINNVEGNKYIRKGKICDIKIFNIKWNDEKKEKKKNLNFLEYKLQLRKKNV